MWYLSVDTLGLAQNPGKAKLFTDIILVVLLLGNILFMQT